MAQGKHSIRSILLATCVAAFAVPESEADEIYHWIDEDGSVHYSDQKPGHDAPVTVIEIEAAPATPYNDEDDPYSILNQAARTHQRWLDIQAASLARAEARAETVDYRDESQRHYDDGYDSYIEYGNYYPYYAYWPANPGAYRPGQGRQQIYALNTLDLLGPRPSSINSGAHRDRVYRSQFLPLVPAPPVVQPVAR
jgi:hypothetical protein